MLTFFHLLKSGSIVNSRDPKAVRLLFPDNSTYKIFGKKIHACQCSILYTNIYIFMYICTLYRVHNVLAKL